MSIIELSTNIEDLAEYEPLPSGWYNAEVRDVEVRHSEKVPNGYFYIQMMIPVENFPADYDVGNAPEGLIVTYARIAVPTAENRRTVAPFKKWLRAVGASVEGSTIDPNAWIGAEVRVQLSVNTYQGAPVNNVEDVRSVVEA